MQDTNKSETTLTKVALSTHSGSGQKHSHVLAMSQQQPTAALAAVVNQMGKSTVQGDLSAFASPATTVRNIALALHSNPRQARLDKVDAESKSPKYQNYPNPFDAALCDMISEMANSIHKLAVEYLGANPNRVPNSSDVFLECAKKRHTDPPYCNFNGLEIKDAFDLAAKSGILSYQIFSVKLFYDVMDLYAEKRLPIVAAITQINDQISADNTPKALGDAEHLKRAELRAKTIKTAADEIEQATKINTRFRRTNPANQSNTHLHRAMKSPALISNHLGIGKVPEAYCNADVVNELINRGVLPADCKKGWGEYLQNFATTKQSDQQATYGSFLAEKMRGGGKESDYKHLASGLNIGLTCGWNTELADLTLICKGQPATPAMLADWAKHRSDFLEIAKTEFCRALFWTVMQPYQSPESARAQDPDPTLSEAQQAATDWEAFCAASIGADDLPKLFSAIQHDASKNNLSNTKLNELLLPALKSKPMREYTAVGLARFILTILNSPTESSTEQAGN